MRYVRVVTLCFLGIVFDSVSFFDAYSKTLEVEKESAQENSAWLPKPLEMFKMRSLLSQFGVTQAEGTHYPIQTLIVGTPRKDAHVAYFFIHPYFGVYTWMLEEYFYEGNDIRVVAWFFSETTIRVRSASLLYGERISPTEVVTKEHFRFGEAISKSQQAWNLLCEKFSCRASSEQ